MKKYFVYIKTGIYLLAIALIFGFATKKNGARKLTSVVVSFENDDNLFLTSENVNNLLIQNVGNVKNQPKSSINLQELENLIQSHSMVSFADVSMGITGKLNVEIKQRKPLARMFNPQNVIYIDTKGGEMPLSENYSARVPIINNRNGLIKPEEVFPLIKKIDADTFMKKIVVSVKKNDAGFWLSTRINKQQVLLGDLENISGKLKKLKVFYNYMENDSLANTFKKIDLQYNNQIVCSK
ncbi:cell division protein FtsQ/DivIB [Wenyingzhuangia sp. IMCC45574]